MAGSTMEGRVKFFNEKARYGFVCLYDESGECVGEFFFHASDVTGDFPQQGDTVSFILDDPPSRARRRELIAVEVEKIADRNTVTFAPNIIEKDRADECELMYG